MGIPSYFAHLVRRHRKIIKEHDPETKIDNLYLDCNSLIYDAVRDILKKKYKTDVFEKKLISAVCEKLEMYFSKLKPTSRIYIAFDGMAPVAKLEQQRNRRYKGWFQSKLMEEIDPDFTPMNWSTASITPGTKFMNTLGSYVKKHFSSPSKFNVEHLIVSTSAEAGEGEHKIYAYIRDNPEHHANTHTVIYGLDADLIMLTLNHLHVAPSMCLYRETPDFIRSLDKTLNPNCSYMLDIPEFAIALGKELGGSRPVADRIRDYILLCFFLGNDFLPHFPALNIRTDGLDRLMSAYRKVCKNTDGLTEGNEIIWCNVRKLIAYLAKHEHEYILTEYSKRTRQSRNVGKYMKTVEDRLMSIPLRDRDDEFYIDPEDDGWEWRYYHRLFDIRMDTDSISDANKKAISINYLEGLEWTLKYYTTGCFDWRWTYQYNYPPLLSDLLPYVPHFQQTILIPSDKGPVTDIVQLSYVLPMGYLHLLPQDVYARLIKKYPEWYNGNYTFSWAFCRYFWESHALLPHIDISKLEEIVG